MDDIPFFKDLEFPDRPGCKVIDFMYEEIEGSLTRVYYNPISTVERHGFLFYVTEYYTQEGGAAELGEGPYDDSNFRASCMFWGVCYFDGVRHLYMGDQATKTDGYLNYPNTRIISIVFSVLRGLELKYCHRDQLD